MTVVRIIKNYQWKGYELQRQTPGGTGAWGNVRFTEEPIVDCDYVVVLNYAPADTVVRCSPRNIWALMQEPYLPDIFGWISNGHEQFTRVFIPSDELSGSKYIPSQTCLPWYDYDKISSYDNMIKLDIPRKPKNISLITSTKNSFPGHLRRLKLVRYLQENKPFDVDLFGRGINPIENKWDAIAPYKYSIAIENTKSSHYWTEKLADCFLAYTLPIYYGAEKLEEYFPAESFIRIDIEDIEGSIETIKEVLKNDIWEDRLPAIKAARELVLNKYQLFPFLAERITQDSGAEREKKAVYLRGFSKAVGYVKKPDQLFSVVLCTYNRAELLLDCLQSLAAQTFNSAQYEVIIVNNNSTDNTQHVAEEFCGKYANCRVVIETEHGLSNARNRGIQEASGEYIAFIDDDARARENWLEIAARIIAEHKPDIFGGPIKPYFKHTPPNWYKPEYAVRGDMGETGWLKEGYISGTNIFFKKSLLVDYGCFDVELGMKGEYVGYHEETQLVYRAFSEGKKVYFCKELIVDDLVPEYKTSLPYMICARYMNGYDGAHLLKSDFKPADISRLVDLVNTTMEMFNYSLRKRNIRNYRYPENYVIEEAVINFVEIGKIIKNAKDNYSRNYLEPGALSGAQNMKPETTKLNIAYLTNMPTSLSMHGGFVHVTQVASRLLGRGHKLHTNLLSESDMFVKLTEEELFERGNEIDAFYIRLHGESSNDRLTFLRCANFDAPCIWEINAPLEELSTRGIAEEQIRADIANRKQLASMVDAAVCVSAEMEEYARNELGIEKTFVVPNGSDVDMFSPEKKDPAFHKDRFKVLWAGSQEFAWQGFRIVQEFAQRIKEIDKDILVIVTAEGRSTENMVCLGRVPYAEMPKYMASADAGLCIYERIDFFKTFFFSPLKLYDYMASGIPVVGSDVGQIKVVLEEHGNGLLTNSSIEDLIEKILYLKNNKEHSTEMGRRGRAAALTFYNWDRVTSQTDDILHRLIDERKIEINEKGGLKDAGINALKLTLMDKYREIREQVEAAGRKDLLIAERDHLLARKDQRINDLLNSFSWRLTAPLRAAYDMLLAKRKKHS